jgi:hypothetical protein
MKLITGVAQVPSAVRLWFCITDDYPTMTGGFAYAVKAFEK